ncbi:MAG TPA: SDR family oxidoreductase [Devosia sp.]|jgi:NAD(P)-dependent dehydrogenase (short-subunit alcohol dehydrogenase family)|uniref:SDR family NAD(P)-dependent oxidoreductase n=1 Tax=Devosia sp. TaxID=1871048 RepID=UPI002DDDB584|nr:SDR family oxidoreductase [Devosia sp.]HEV2516301.1 SDR family oxidoreductase [Devosia sp.]
MRIELENTFVELRGEQNAIAMAVLDALRASGATVDAVAPVPDILIVSLPLLPDAEFDPAMQLASARASGAAMFSRGSGRILFLVSAAAGMPMRRHAEFSVSMAGVMATVRTMAMQLGPRVLVNALGVGAVGEPLLAGDAAMLGHASVKRPGTVAEVADTALFFCDPLNSYTTGQLLSVDGGWSAGYGRNF